VNLLPVFDEEVKVDLGIPSDEASRAAVLALAQAITDYKDGHYDVLVTCPVDKSNLHVEGIRFSTCGKFVETCIGEGHKCLDILMNDYLRVALMTDDIALKDGAGAITKDAIIEKAASFFSTLRRDLRIANPHRHPGSTPTTAMHTPARERARPSSCPCSNWLKPASKLRPIRLTSFSGAANTLLSTRAGHVPDRAWHRSGMALRKTSLIWRMTLVSTSPTWSVLRHRRTGVGRGTFDRPSSGIDGFRNRRNYDEPTATRCQALPRAQGHSRRAFSIPKKQRTPSRKAE
jgi:4-hydroxythreonine-4-phosphate dehydrogenase